jgi:hypothetical protein
MHIFSTVVPLRDIFSNLYLSNKKQDASIKKKKVTELHIILHFLLQQPVSNRIFTWESYTSRYGFKIKSLYSTCI